MKINVRVPATTANLGAGFNCLGLALELYNDLELEETDGESSIEICGEGEDSLPRNEDNLCLQATKAVLDRCGYRPKGLRFRLTNRIPITKGLGSSAAAIVASAVATNQLCGNGLPTDELIQVCSNLEGHADNIVAAFIGGLTVCGYRDNQVVYKNFFIRRGIRAIVAIAEIELKTKDAISLLPQQVPFEDAVFNISRCGLFLSGIISDDLDLMGLGMEDRLHQPYRIPLIPGVEGVFKEALRAGAHGVALSGAGPSVVAITNRYPQPIGEAMEEAFKRNGIESKVMILDVDNKGIKIQQEK